MAGQKHTKSGPRWSACHCSPRRTGPKSLFCIPDALRASSMPELYRGARLAPPHSSHRHRKHAYAMVSLVTNRIFDLQSAC